MQDRFQATAICSRVRKKHSHPLRPKSLVGRYPNDPVAYCHASPANGGLGVRLTERQQEVAMSLVTPPYKTMVRASNTVGKTFLAACLVCWWYDTFNPGIVLTTAPKYQQVVKLLWKEVRRLRTRAGLAGFAGPKAPHLEDHPEHYAMGMTARDATAFQGHHGIAVLVIFDEAVGVDKEFWTATDSMLSGDRYAFLGIYNPTDQSSEAYSREQEPGYRVLSLNCFEHPNIQAELDGRSPPYPSAVRLAWLKSMLEREATRLAPGDTPAPGDVQLDGVWWRLGPVAEARLAGRWPSLAIAGVWSEALWNATAKEQKIDPRWPVQIGCDVARFGDDATAIHVRQGLVSLHHESHHGWSTAQTCLRLRQLARDHAPAGVPPTSIPILVDVGGLGAGVVDHPDGYNFVGVNSAAAAQDAGRYTNTRSELWFRPRTRRRRGALIPPVYLPLFAWSWVGNSWPRGTSWTTPRGCVWSRRTTPRPGSAAVPMMRMR
jgi:hypothetical protein